MRTTEELIKQARKIMPNAKYIAQDRNGVWYAYLDKPFVDEGAIDGHFYVTKNKSKRLGVLDWEGSLFKLPPAVKQKMYRWTLLDSTGVPWDTSSYYTDAEIEAEFSNNKILRRLDNTMIEIDI